MSIYVIAEIGINHNGSLETAKRLIDAAKEAGCDAVKFQKRTIEAVYSEEELSRPRDSVFGSTNGDLKRGLEFGVEEFDAISAECEKKGLAWSASCWDRESVDFIAAYRPPWLKVPSALLTHKELLSAYRNTGLPLLVSTGMSTWAEIDAALYVLSEHVAFQHGELVRVSEKNRTLLHCHSAYPSPLEEINLACIQSLKARYGLPVGYSSHTVSPWPCLMAVCMGAEVVEFHLTLDRSMWGSDQSASLEPAAATKLVEEIRTWERCKGDGDKKVYASEEAAKAKLRR